MASAVEVQAAAMVQSAITAAHQVVVADLALVAAEVVAEEAAN
jgi:hypothetical protein